MINKKLVHLVLLLSSLLPCFLSQELVAQTTKYTVKSEDTVYGLAKRNHTTIDEIYQLNPELKRRELRQGEVIILPDKSIMRQPQELKQETSARYIKHRIAKGQTLSAISRQYGVSVADILKMNPEISADRYPEGFILLVPKVGDTPVTTPSIDPIFTLNTFKSDTVRVSVVLPLGKLAPDRYIHFYEGFLMGLNDLKKSGVSTILHTYDVRGASDIERICKSGALLTEHLLIGGSNEEEISALAHYARNHRLNYVVPFSSQISDDAMFSTLFKINPKQESLYPKITREFVRRYANSQIIILSAPSDMREDPIIPHLISSLREAGVSYRIRSLDNVGTLESNAVVVPATSSYAFLQRLLNKLEAQNSHCHLFGYPEWQASNKLTLDRLAKFRTTIYTSFFFDPTAVDSSTFLHKYNAWYSHRVPDTYPKYAVLGYDIARYFVRATASYGTSFPLSLAQIPSDGLQSDFHFVRPKGTSLFINGNVYFVTMRVGQSPLRESILF